MTPFVYASETAYCVLLLAYIISAFVGVVCFAMSVSYKLKPLYVLPEVIVSAVSVFLLGCYLSGARVRYFGEDTATYTFTLFFMPTWSVIVIAVLLLSLAVFWLVLVVNKRLSTLTAMSVKEAIAVISSGLCFYDGSGRLLLQNEQIDDECKIITGESLYDGKTFWSNLRSGNRLPGITVTLSEDSVIVERPDGRATCYKRILHDFDGKTVYEITGADVTQELALKKEIESKNEALRKMNLRLRKYGETVAEVTKERETLTARVKVHANLGSLILRTKKSLSCGDYDRDALISEWNDVTSVIFASDEKDKFTEACKTASSIGVRILSDGKRPEKGTLAEKIFADATFECAVNTARHADGNELYVKIADERNFYRIVFTNNGKRPDGAIKEGGGLSSLRTMTENAGGRMTVVSEPEFTLTITIPKEEPADER